MPRTLIALGLTAASLALASGEASAAQLSQSWNLHKTAGRGAVITDAGSVRGALFGAGTIRLRTAVHPDGSVAFNFRERLGGGTVTGEGQLTYRLNPSHTKVVYRGAGRITNGTGRYTHVRLSLRLSGTGLPDATERISITA